MRILEPDNANLLSLTAAWARVEPGDAVVYAWEHNHARFESVRGWADARLHVKRIGDRLAHIAVKRT